MKQACMLCYIFGLLVIIGAINWGLVGLLGLDLVAKIFGPMTMLSRVVYVLIGAAGLFKLFTMFMDCPMCNKS